MQTRQLTTTDFQVSVKGDDVYLRMYGITDDVLTINKWLARNSQVFSESLKGQPVVNYDTTPSVHNPRKLYTNLEKWRADSAAVAVGIIEELDWNDATKAHDVIWKVTDPDVKAVVLDSLNSGKPLPWRFSSPAIWGLKMRRDPTGIKIYDEWTGVNMAIMKENPAYPKEIAQINENVCIGGIKCAQELAAVAAGPPSEEKTENFTFDRDTEPKNQADIVKMSAETDTKRTVPYEEYITKTKEIDSINSKYQESLKVNEKLAAEKESIVKEKDSILEKWTVREKQDKEKLFTEKFGKILKTDDEVKEKVALFLEKNYTEDDFNNLYGPMLKEVEETEKADRIELEKKVTQMDKAGVAASVSKDGHLLRSNIDTALSIFRRMPY